MARETFEAWIPEEYGGPVITKIGALSAVESMARVEPMGSDTKHVPRSGGVSITTAIPKGTAYPETSGVNDDVLLTAIKLGNVLRVEQEDLADTSAVANIIQTKQLEWARAYAVAFDNATLGTTAASNGTTVPFTSLYKALRTTAGAYTADTNRVATAGTGAGVTYAQISSLFGKLEGGDYWNDADMSVVAHPAFKAQLRSLVDSQGRPLFTEYQSAGAGPVATLLGVPVPAPRPS
jgi:HK97 family phage major capsid protein